MKLAADALVVVLVGTALLHLLEEKLLIFLLLLLNNLQQVIDPLNLFLMLILVYVLLVAAAVRESDASLIGRINIPLPLCDKFVFKVQISLIPDDLAFHITLLYMPIGHHKAIGIGAMV